MLLSDSDDDDLDDRLFPVSKPIVRQLESAAGSAPAAPSQQIHLEAPLGTKHTKNSSPPSEPPVHRDHRERQSGHLHTHALRNQIGRSHSISPPRDVRRSPSSPLPGPGLSRSPYRRSSERYAPPVRSSPSRGDYHGPPSHRGYEPDYRTGSPPPRGADPRHRTRRRSVSRDVSRERFNPSVSRSTSPRRDPSIEYGPTSYRKRTRSTALCAHSLSPPPRGRRSRSTSSPAYRGARMRSPMHTPPREPDSMSPRPSSSGAKARGRGAVGLRSAGAASVFSAWPLSSPLAMSNIAYCIFLDVSSICAI
jgi:hypothetical protein